MAKAEMALILSLVDEATKTAKAVKGELGEVGKTAQGLQGQLAGVGQGLAKLGAGVVLGGIGLAVTAVTALGTAAFAAGMAVDDAMDTIAISTGATGDQLAALGDDFSAVFTSIPVDADAAAAAIAGLNKGLGLTGPSLQDASRNLLEMTRLLGGDAKTNAALLTRVIGDWGVATEDTADTLDLMFKASQLTGVGVEDLMGKVVAFGSPLRLMGFSLEDSVAMFAKWEKEGVNAELVMGSLRIAAGKFARDNIPLQEGLQDTITEIMNMEDASAALALGMDVFGARAGPDMVAAIREGRFAIDDLKVALEGSEGAILAAADATADFPEKLKILKNVATDALAPLGLAMMDVVTTLVEKLTPGFQVATAWLQEHLLPVVEDVAAAVGMLIDGDLQGALASLFGEETAGKVMGFLDGFQAAIEAIWGWLNENWEPVLAGLAAIVVAAFGAWAAAAIPAAIATVTAMAPIILVIAAIGAAAALLAKAWKEDWGGIQEKTAAVVGWIQETVGAFLALIRGWWAENGEAIIGTVTRLWDTVSGAFNTGVDWVKSVISDALATIRAWWAEHGEQIMAIVDKFMLGIELIIVTVTSVIKEIFGAFRSAFEGDWRAFGEHLRAAWQLLWSGLSQAFTKFKEVLLGIWNLVKADVTRVWDGILTWFGELPAKIIRFFTETDWGQIGRGILDGIANALKNGIDWIKDAAKRVAQAALDAMKGLLGISSPSRVAMFEVGMPIGEGVAEGLRAATPDILAASRLMMDGGMAAISGAGYMPTARVPVSSAQSGGGTILGFSREALQQLFEMNAASITMPLAATIAERLNGGSSDEMRGTLRALGAA